MTSITRDEWLQAVAAAGYTEEHDEHAITLSEFVDLFKVPRQTATGQLRRLEEMGKAVRTQKIVTNSYGRRIRYIAWRLVTP